MDDLYRLHSGSLLLKDSGIPQSDSADSDNRYFPVVFFAASTCSYIC